MRLISPTVVGLIVCALFFVPARAAGSIDPNDPPQGLFSDEWTVIHLAGGKVGYGHSTTRREGDIIHTTVTMTMEIRRAAASIKLQVVQGTTETLTGQPLTFRSEMDLSSQKMTITGKVEDGKVTIIQSQYGFDKKSTFDYPPGAVMLWGAYRESLRRGFEPGTEYTLQLYEPSLRFDGPVEATTTIHGWETFQHGGKTCRGIKAVQQLDSPMGSLEMLSWTDADGKVLLAEVPMPGLGNMRLYATDQATAMRDFVPPEMFVTTAIKVRPIDDDKARRIRYLLKPKSLSAEPLDLPVTGMQKVVSREDQAVELLVTRQPHKPSEHHKPDKAAIDLAEYLDGNLMINVDDPALRKLADTAAGDVTEPFALGDRLRRFVTDYIRKKNLDIGFASASEVCRNREGDCSEHGVLLAALGRLKGLPSRVVAGIAYAPTFGHDTHLFVYHMWTQFYINGQWYDFDSALRETECSPARIAFAVSSLKDASLADLSLPLISIIGAVDLEVLQVE